MARTYDVLVVGAGPAGMAAAVRLRRSGLSVVLVDEQPGPGGQIWRAVEARAETPAGRALGPDYRAGADHVCAFRACGADYHPNTQLWQLEPGWRAYVSRDARSETLDARKVLLATGAQERPVPFPGWTLPGVLTVGAAQILLKSSEQVPAAPVWVAGSGPLPLLYLTQLLEAGGRVAGFLDTTPMGNLGAAGRHLPRALAGWKDLAKGFKWMTNLRRSGLRTIRNVTALEAVGEERLTGIRYRKAGGRESVLEASTLLVHEGIVPGIHATLALGCAHHWSEDQLCLAPRVDDFGATSRDGIHVAGDAAGIAGAEAALLSGEIAAIGIAAGLGRHSVEEADRLTRPLRRRLARMRAVRPFLDTLFKPRREIFAPPDKTIVCRCEEVTATQIRQAITLGQPGPNQIKAFTRAGMGPCQGRQCGYSVAHLIAAGRNLPVADIGFFNIRSPLKPISVGELAALHDPAEPASPSSELQPQI